MQKYETTAAVSPSAALSRSAWLTLLLLSIVAAPTLAGAGLAFVASVVASIPLGPALIMFTGGGLLLGAMAAGGYAFYLALHPPVDHYTTIEHGPTRTDIRIVPVAGGTRMIDGIPIEDFEWFIDGLCYPGAHVQSRWRGKTAPSGIVVSEQYWKKLCLPLRKVKVIEGTRHRVSGNLTLTNPDQIRAMFGLGPRRKV